MIDLERVQETHRILFQDVYPWAGDDRSTNAADLNITKGAISFQAAPYVPQGLSQALKSGNDINSFKNDPGKTIGELAYAHPFLDGNGRTITAVTSELARRAGFHIAWQETDKVPYLNALTKDLDEPNKGHLTAYLKPFMRESELGREEANLTLSTLPGLSAPNQNLERVQETQAILTIVAGSNGSGKSSLTSSGAFGNTKIVDPDAIARAISPDNPEAAARRADKRALDQRKELLDKQQSFVVETTLSGNSTLSLMDEVAKLGFRVELKYIGLDNVDLAKSRVATRVASCGHNIPIDDIERRYSRSFENLPEAISKADHTTLYDNSGKSPHRQIAQLERENFVFDRAPQWATDAAFSSTQLELGKAQTVPELERATQRAFDAARAGGVSDDQLTAEVRNLARYQSRRANREGHDL